jgi:hypothetical protein
VMLVCDTQLMLMKLLVLPHDIGKDLLRL